MASISDGAMAYLFAPDSTTEENQLLNNATKAFKHGLAALPSRSLRPTIPAIRRSNQISEIPQLDGLRATTPSS